MTVTFAQNRAYMTYACRYSDDSPFAYMMLHVKSPIGPGTNCELNGYWHVTYTDVGMDPSITGDATGWYSVFTQGSFLYVMKGYVSAGGSSTFQNFGNGFSGGGFILMIRRLCCSTGSLLSCGLKGAEKSSTLPDGTGLRGACLAMGNSRRATTIPYAQLPGGQTCMCSS